jgi:hypothetical protein
MSGLFGAALFFWKKSGTRASSVDSVPETRAIDQPIEDLAEKNLEVQRGFPDWGSIFGDT